MAVLRAIVADRDGVIHELVLRKRDKNAGFSWFYGDAPLVVTPARTQEEAVEILKNELSPTPENPLQVVSISRQVDDQV